MLQPLTVRATPSGVAISGSGSPSTVFVHSVVAHPNIVVESILPLVSIQDGTHVFSVRSEAGSVAKVLAEQAVFVDERDIVEPSLSSPLSSLHTIQITRVTSRIITESKEIAPGVQYQSDPTLNQGVEIVKQSSKNGNVVNRFEIISHNGIDVGKRLLTTETVAASNGVTLRGSKVVEQTVGGASWYAGGPGLLTAAHRTLPFGTKVLVTNQANGLSVVVTIADRGPFIGGRIIDLSPDSFAKIAGLGSGVVRVSMSRL